MAFNSNLRNYRRGVLKQMGEAEHGPAPYRPTVQSDEMAASVVSREAEKFQKALPIRRQEHISRLIGESQDKAASEIVRARVSAYTHRFVNTDDLVPFKILDQNLDRVFLAIANETFTGVTTQLVWYSFGPPSIVGGPALFPNVTGIQIAPGARDIYNNGVIPLDELWLTFHPSAGGLFAFVTVYEGVSMGNLIS